MAQVQAEQIANRSFGLKSNLIIGMCLFYFLNFFIQAINFDIALALLSLSVFILSLRHAKSTPRVLAGIMFVLGIFFTLSKGEGVAEISSGITMNLPLLVLVLLVPLLSIPLKVRGYFKTVRFFLENMAVDTKKIFGSISFFIFCMGPVLNLGSIRVLHETIKDIKLSSVLLAKSYLVGFSTVILWSPYFASVALVLYYLEVPFANYVPLGLTMAVIQMIIGNLLFRFYSRAKGTEQGKQEEAAITELKEVNSRQNSIHKKKLWSLIGIITLLMGSIFLLEYITKWPMMLLVSAVSVGYPLLWSLVTRQWKSVEKHFIEFKDRSLPRMNNEVVLFISAGLFGKALQGTIIAAFIRKFLNHIASMSFLLFILAVMGIIVSLCFIGIHQIVVVTALVTQMDASFIGTTPEVLALLIMISWSMAAVLSPVNPLNLLVSGSVKHSGMDVGFKWNGIYLLSMFVIGTIFVYAVH
ncbi:hypothetical protein SAMN05421743_10486 [Thalassobacillus cyri]|uniref:Uncharacterized protein n=2 Tax=Thalassobacillus cyri TaxID=571932 RepID=A0A1H4AGG0_9BACI|nr:hypothetical protein SAMN05421743_10486 [Thalassobacillus cyri]